MAERHVDALFAPAYDGRLDATARHRFESHLARCDRCSAAFADHSAAGDALRLLPAARMPVPVRLPTHAPRPARAGLLERLLPHPVLGLSLAGVAAAAVVLVAVGVYRGSGGETKSAAVAGTGFTQSSTASGFAPNREPASQPGGGAALANSVNVVRSGRPGEVLVVATASKTYAPGAQVVVEARLVQVTAAAVSAAPAAAAAVPAAGASTSSSAASAPVPAVTPGALAIAPADAPVFGGTLIALPLVRLGPDLIASTDGGFAAASPTPIAVAVSSGTPGEYVVTIPLTARPGEVLRIVATVPSGEPTAADTTSVEAVLQITVG